MTNFGALAILALPKMPERQLRFLLALETVPARGGGWREVRTELLARQAHQSVTTTVKARAELAGAGMIEYRPGTGPGHPGRYRLPSAVSKPPRSAGRVKPGKNAGRVNPANSGPGSLPNGPQKPITPNAVTSADVSTALEPIALEPSALSRAASDPRTILAGLGATGEETDFILGKLQADPRWRGDPAGHLMDRIGNGDGPRIIQWARRQLQPRPDWCGQCDEHTRMIEVEPDGRPMKCPRCSSWNASRERL